MRLDGKAGLPVVEIICGSAFDLGGFYREKGYTVIETAQRGRVPLFPLLPANCVGLVRGVLAIGAPWVLTPWQLYRHLTRRGFQLLPGKAVFDPPKPKAAPRPAPAAVPTTVERDDPDVTAAREEARQAELRRRGRAATILTGGAGVPDDAQLGRPAAGGANAATSKLG